MTLTARVPGKYSEHPQAFDDESHRNAHFVINQEDDQPIAMQIHRSFIHHHLIRSM